MFTVEEINLMCIYNTDTRSGLISELKQALGDVTDLELLEIFENAAAKLEAMTDGAYIEIQPYLIPAEEYTGGEE